MRLIDALELSAYRQGNNNPMQLPGFARCAGREAGIKKRRMWAARGDEERLGASYAGRMQLYRQDPAPLSASAHAYSVISTVVR